MTTSGARRRVLSALAAIAVAVFVSTFAFTHPARAADPIKVGFSVSLTGAVAPNGKQILLSLEIWRDDVNAKGGLLGRPIQLVYYTTRATRRTCPTFTSSCSRSTKSTCWWAPTRPT